MRFLSSVRCGSWLSEGLLGLVAGIECEDNVGNFFDSTGILHHEFTPKGQTTNQEYYKCVLQRLREKVRKKRPALWKDRSWVLRHENAPAHRAFSIVEFLTKFNIPVLPQPPYSLI